MLLDTSGMLALLDAREPMHARACQLYSQAPQRVTHGYVLAELIALGNARGVPPSTILKFVMSLLANPDILTIWPDEVLTSQSLALLMARQGRGYSLCDAMSFIVMRIRNFSNALTTDQHFETEGLVRLLV